MTQMLAETSTSRFRAGLISISVIACALAFFNYGGVRTMANSLGFSLGGALVSLVFVALYLTIPFCLAVAAIDILRRFPRLRPTLPLSGTIVGILIWLIPATPRVETDGLAIYAFEWLTAASIPAAFLCYAPREVLRGAVLVLTIAAFGGAIASESLVLVDEFLFKRDVYALQLDKRYHRARA
jgi:hypothetical protein